MWRLYSAKNKLQKLIMEIHLSYKRAYINELLRKSNLPNAEMLGAKAIGLMEWALDETIGGRIIVALDLETERARPIHCYSLEHAKMLRVPKSATETLEQV